MTEKKQTDLEKIQELVELMIDKDNKELIKSVNAVDKVFEEPLNKFINSTFSSIDPFN